MRISLASASSGSRPDDWKQLLAAKILFVAAFINLPLLIVDVTLLVKAGFGLPLT